MNLPSIFQNNNLRIDKINDTYYSKTPTKSININDKINNIFKSTSYIYKIEVIITTNKYTKPEIIIGKSNNYLITYNKELIPIKDIIDIKLKNDT